MVPEGLRLSTLPTLAFTFLIALGGLFFGADLEHFMIFFASIFLSGAIVLVLSVVRPDRPSPSDGKTLLVGILSLAVMAIGYFETQPLLMAAGVVIPVSVLPLMVLWGGKQEPFAPRSIEEANGQQRRSDASVAPVAASSEPVRAAVLPTDDLVNSGLPMSAQAHPSDGWFEDRWFTVPHIPTYTDTNSVGNVYFANYVAWVGKARELFFRTCMPDFNIDNTDFFILTRSFNHKFIREIREFQAVKVRLRIGGFNRKFVKLEHKIEVEEGGLIGSGDQTLMFVESSNYGLIDIPGQVYSAFIPYAPQEKQASPV